VTQSVDVFAAASLQYGQKSMYNDQILIVNQKK